MTKLTKGIRFGETYYLGAGVKMGKSEIVNTLTAHLITEHDLSVFLAKPEEANRKTVQLVAGKIAGRFFHDPEVDFDYEAYDAATTRIGSRLHLLNLYQHLGWDSLRSDIIAAHANGCRAVFIDPITNLTNGVASGEANTQLQEIAQELAAMALDLDIVIFIFCHLKAPESGNPHERGGKVLSYQFAGSRAMMRSCHLMLGLEGTKDPDLPTEERNLRRLVVLEDREFGSTGYINLYWDNKTGLFTEIPNK
jgi:twinkle protein